MPRLDVCWISNFIVRKSYDQLVVECGYVISKLGVISVRWRLLPVFPGFPPWSSLRLVTSWIFSEWHLGCIRDEHKRVLFPHGVAFANGFFRYCFSFVELIWIFVNNPLGHFQHGVHFIRPMRAGMINPNDAELTLPFDVIGIAVLPCIGMDIVHISPIMMAISCASRCSRFWSYCCCNVVHTCPYVRCNDDVEGCLFAISWEW